MAVISSPVVAALVWIMNWGGPQFYIYVWGFLFGTWPSPRAWAIKANIYEFPLQAWATDCISQFSSW